MEGYQTNIKKTFTNDRNYIKGGYHVIPTPSLVPQKMYAITAIIML